VRKPRAKTVETPVEAAPPPPPAAVETKPARKPRQPKAEAAAPVVEPPPAMAETKPGRKARKAKAEAAEPELPPPPAPAPALEPASETT
jgi:hypothetical protein